MSVKKETDNDHSRSLDESGSKAADLTQAQVCAIGLRNTGIELVGDVPWGTHFCLFYQTPEDLLEMLIPYFKAGLENNEFCMWITSYPLTAHEATKAMSREIPDFDEYVNKGQISIIPHTEWYLKDGFFDQERVLAGWISMLDHALLEGYEGLRLSGNTYWLEDPYWLEFNRYEATVDKVIGNFRMLAACTYSLEKCGSSEIIDVVSTHQFAITKRGGEWQIIESSDHRRTRDALEQERNTKQSYLDLASVFVIAVDLEGMVTLVNRRGAAILGLPVGEILGKNFIESFLTEATRVETKLGFEKMIEDGEQPDDHYETPVLGSTGEERIIAWRYTLLRDSSGGANGVLACGDDITERKRSEKQMRLAVLLNQALHEINLAMNSTLDLEQVILEVMEKSAEALESDSVYTVFRKSPKDWCVQHSYGKNSPEAGYSFKTEESPAAWRLLAKQKPVVIADVAKESAGALINNFSNKSFLAAPLFRQSRILGMLCFGFTAHKEFNPAHVDFAEKLAVSVSLAIENARLYAIEQQSRGDIQSYATRLSLLHEIGLSLNQQTDRENLLKSILDSAAEMTSAGVGCMLLIQEHMTKVVSLYYAPWYKSRCDITNDVSELHKHIKRLMQDTFRNVRRITNGSNDDAVTMMPEGHIDLRGLLIGELSDTRGKILGYFVLSDKANGADFNPEDEEIISLLASQSSVALVSTENYEREHWVAETLQSTLLPEFPEHKNVEVGLIYRSGSKAGRIGGDFYDFIDLGGDQVAVVIGDVCGKGLTAASYTAMVKYMLQAYLAEGLTPGECLTKLNTSICKALAEDKFITLGLAILNFQSRTVAYSLAGHPLPIISHEGGAFELEMPQTIPLGVQPGYSFLSHETSMAKNTSLLMYTDGIIEARSSAGELYGRKRLKTAFIDRRYLPAQTIAQKLVNRVMDFSHGHLHDDVALVVIQTKNKDIGLVD